LTDPLERLRQHIAAAESEPYLLTVTDDHRPQCSSSTVTWEQDRLVVPAPSGWDQLEVLGAYRMGL
jgi:hypothetical protein